MDEAFTFHLLFDCSMLRKKNAAVFAEAHGKWLPDKGSDMRISKYKINHTKKTVRMKNVLQVL